MHIPDGFLNAATAVTTSVVSAGGIGYSVKRANKKLGEAHVPLMGIMGAFIFAAQMLNFPVAGGTSGHLIGGALAAILLGPWAGTLIMACVLIVQCLVFQDGGITALGANIFNMGLCGQLRGVLPIPSRHIADRRKPHRQASRWLCWSLGLGACG